MNKQLKVTIQYIVKPEECNLRELMETLQDYGDARIIDVAVVDKEE